MLNILRRILIGAKKGWNTPTLPDKILKFQMHPLIRILRVLGGICTIFLLSNKGQDYPSYIIYITLLFSIIFLIYHMYISYHRTIHIYKTLKSDKLDIRNSPLDHLARLSSRILLCAKGACDQAQPVGVAMGIMLGVDTALEKADHKAIFGPILGKALSTILPKSDIQVKNNVTDLIKKPFSDLENNNNEIDQIDRLIDRVSDWNKADNNQVNNDAKDIISELNKHKSDIIRDNSRLKSKILDELYKSDPFSTKKK